ncbi:hypothetical protein EVAR_12649_1 [Eumeta japonica]|uniref:Uncharacterized protein n=1 Tax=Eumeta variegata TaxID=151549 RepID=A0A4C1Z9Y3_EUMVA|nr:hypothetical protein EVAR_12649_1 [Eumeta japonica]
MSILHTLAPVRVGSVGLKPTEKFPLKMKLTGRLCYVAKRRVLDKSEDYDGFTERGRTTHKPSRVGFRSSCPTGGGERRPDGVGELWSMT